MPFLDDQGKEALNFNITFSIAGTICLILILFLVVIGYFLLIGLSVVWFVFVIIATIRAGEGEAYRYPLSVRFIK